MIKTKRLLLRRVKKEDWKAIQRIWKDEAVSPYAQYDNIKELDDLSVADMNEAAKKYKPSHDENFLLAMRSEDERGRWNYLPGTKDLRCTEQ